MKQLILMMVLVSGMLHRADTAMLYASKNARISLYSNAPLEDIEGISNAGRSVYNATTGELMFSVPIRWFRFQKSLMEEHFNENYMESDKYPQATFKGRINEKVNVTADGTYPVTVTGLLDIHGVKQNRTVKGTVTVKNGVVSMASEFMVKCAGHQIEIPKLVFQKIAESLKLTVSATYTTYK